MLESLGPGSLLTIIDCLMEKNWPSRVPLFCKCVFLSPAKISVFIHFHLQSIEPAWGEYKRTLISERTLRSYQKGKTRRFLWELDSISRNQWVTACYSENVGVDNCRFDLTLQLLHCLCLSQTNLHKWVLCASHRFPPKLSRRRDFTSMHAFSSFQFSRSVVSDSLQPHESQHARPPCPSPTPRVHSNSRPSSGWCHPAISSSVVPFSSCPQSFPASGSFPMSQLFAWSGQSTGVSALASFLPKKSQGWSPSEWTGCISLVSKGLSRAFSNTTVQKHQFLRPQLSLKSNSHIHTWPLEKQFNFSKQNGSKCTRGLAAQIHCLPCSNVCQHLG